MELPQEAEHQISETTQRTVVVGQRPGRGSSAKYPDLEGFVRIDVSSGSMKNLDGHPCTEMSPLYLGPVIDEEGNSAIRFENYWQYTKAYPQLGHLDDKGNVNDTWKKWKLNGFKLLKKTKNTAKGIRTPPEVSKLKKDKTIKSWAPSYAVHKGQKYTYIEARKNIYVPIYHDLVTKTKSFQKLKELVDNGTKVILVEPDGPPLRDYPSGMLANEENLVKMINDPKYPFGHGYVVAAALLEIPIEKYCKKVE